MKRAEYPGWLEGILWYKQAVRELEEKEERRERYKENFRKWRRRIAIASLAAAVTLIPINMAIKRGYSGPRNLGSASQIEYRSGGHYLPDDDSPLDRESFQEYMIEKYGVSENELNLN